MGIMSRIHLLEISDDDRTKQILKTKETIQKLKTVAQEVINSHRNVSTFSISANVMVPQKI